MTMISPGPFTLWKRPRKNITARSYSRRILIDEAISRTSTISAPTAKYMSVSFRDDVENQPLHARDAQPLAAPHRTGRAHAPLLAAHARPALAGEILHGLAGRADHLLAPGHHRAPADLRQHAEHEYQETGARHRDPRDERVRDVEAGQLGLVVDQHDGAQHEGDDAADAERAEGGQKRLGDHEGDAEQHQR